MLIYAGAKYLTLRSSKAFLLVFARILTESLRVSRLGTIQPNKGAVSLFYLVELWR